MAERAGSATVAAVAVAVGDPETAASLCPPVFATESLAAAAVGDATRERRADRLRG